MYYTGSLSHGPEDNIALCVLQQRAGASNNIGAGVMNLSLSFQAEMGYLNIVSWAEPQELSIL